MFDGRTSGKLESKLVSFFGSGNHRILDVIMETGKGNGKWKGKGGAPGVTNGIDQILHSVKAFGSVRTASQGNHGYDARTPRVIATRMQSVSS